MAFDDEHRINGELKQISGAWRAWYSLIENPVSLRQITCEKFKCISDAFNSSLKSFSKRLTNVIVCYTILHCVNGKRNEKVLLSRQKGASMRGMVMEAEIIVIKV